MEQAEIEEAVGELETRVDRLRALYEQYFMGIEKIEPSVPKKDVERRVQTLRREQIRNTGLRFRFQMILQRYNTYQTYWMRICRQIEEGTYKRDVLRAQKRLGDTGRKKKTKGHEALELDVDAVEETDVAFSEPPPPVAAPPPVPARGAPPPPPLPGRSPAAAAAAPSAPGAPPPGAPATATAGAASAEASREEKMRMLAARIRQNAPGGAPAAPGTGVARPAAPPAVARPAPPAASAATPARSAAPAPPAAAPARPVAPAPTAAASPARPIAPPPTAATSPTSPARPAAPAPAASPARPMAPPPTPAAAARGPSPGSPPAAAARPAPAERPDIPDDRVRQLYAQYVETKRKHQESTAAITYEGLAKTLRESSEKLRQKHGGRQIDFEVTVKDGRTILKPVVK